MQNNRDQFLLYGWNQEESVGKIMSEITDLKFSIVIPTLNQAETIEDTLLSIVNQDYTNYEIIIMDGGSTDQTLTILDRYSEHISHIESGSDGGQSSAINKGFENASGDIYAWINSDDYYLPHAFSNVVRTFNMHQSIDIVVGSGRVITRDCKFLKHMKAIEMNKANLLNWNNDLWIMQQCCFWTKGIWRKVGGVDEDLQLLMDYDLWFRFADVGNSEALQEDLAVMRYYKQTKTISMRKKMDEEVAYVYAKNNAYNELKALVGGLRSDKDELIKAIDRIESHIAIRLLKRLGILT